MSLQECKECAAGISGNALSCPNCGCVTKDGKSFYNAHRSIITGLALIMLMLFLMMISSCVMMMNL